MSDDEEVIVDELIAVGSRRLRVYDSKGDFYLDIPDGAKVTFGYFNPALPAQNRERGFDRNFGPDNVARQTALRIYEKAERGNQLACFLGVKGFRDTSLNMIRLTQRVVVERTFARDDESEQWSGRTTRELRAAPEDDVYE